MRIRTGPLILCYHAISDSWDDALAVPKNAFEQQLANLIRRGYRPATMEDALVSSRRLLHVTFDDAFRSVARALPALERLGVPATLFVCTGYADDGRGLLIPELASRADGHAEELLTMPWDTLKDLLERGFQIGSHTVSHAHLTELSDGDLLREVSDSRDRLESELGGRCRYLAYPFGENDERVRDAARAAGYEAAFSLRAPSRNRELFALPRLDVYRRDGRLRFALKTSRLRRIGAGL